MAWSVQSATDFAKQHGIDLSKTGGLAQGGVVDAAVAANPALRSAYTQAINAANAPQAPATYNNGVVPLSVVPQNIWEQTALQRASQGVNLSDVARDPYAEKFLNQSGDLLSQSAQMAQQAAAPIQQSDISKFYDPYQQEVIDASMTGLSRQAEEMRAQLMKNAQQRGAAGFGSTMTTNPLNALQGRVLETGASLGAGLRSQGYNNALDAAFRERGLGSTAAGQVGNIGANFGNLATAGQNIGISSAGLEQQNISNQLTAGQTLRDFQQGQANVAFQDYLGQQGYPLQQAQNTAGLLPSLNGGVQNQTVYNPSGVSRAAGAVAAGTKLAGEFL